jgi:hypothetical protein
MDPVVTESKPTNPATPAAKPSADARMAEAKAIAAKEFGKIRGDLRGQQPPAQAASEETSNDGLTPDDVAAPAKPPAKPAVNASVEAELARRDRKAREQQAAAKAEADKARAALEAEKAEVGDHKAFLALAKSDPAAFADQLITKLKVDPEDLKQIAAILHWMGEPEEKRPAKLREISRARRAQVETKSEVQLAREKAEKVEAELAALKDQQAKAAVDAQVNAAWSKFLGHVTASIPETAAMTRALFESDPGAVYEGYKQITEALLAEHADDEDFQVTPELLAEKSEAELQKRFGWAARAASGTAQSTTKSKPTNGQKRVSPDGLSNQSKASPGRPAGKMTEAERVEAAKAAWRAANAAT